MILSGTLKRVGTSEVTVMEFALAPMTCSLTDCHNLPCDSLELSTGPFSAARLNMVALDSPGANRPMAVFAAAGSRAMAAGVPVGFCVLVVFVILSPGYCRFPVQMLHRHPW